MGQPSEPYPWNPWNPWMAGTKRHWEWVHEPCEDSGSATTGVWKKRRKRRQEEHHEHEGAHTPTDTAACPESHGQSYASEELFVTNAINQLSAAHCFQ